MSSRWIRLDTTWSSSEWIAALPAESRLCWVELLCYVKAHGTAGTVKALPMQVAARMWGVTRDACDGALRAAIAHGALVVVGSEWTLAKWKTYQGDETSSDRSKRYRESKSRLSPSRPSRVSHGASRSVTDVTPTVTVTETMTEVTTAATTRAHEALAEWLGQHAGCITGMEYVTQLALWGLYGPQGTDERIWGTIHDSQRPPMLATAALRWSSEGHGRFNGRLFRAILSAVIADGTAKANGTPTTQRRRTPDVIVEG